MNSLRKLSLTYSQLLRLSVTRSLTSQSVDATDTEPKKKNILIEKYGAVTMIGINRPEKKNALDCRMSQDLCDALDNFDKDDEAVAGVLHGTGGNFCSGFDLEELTKYDGKNDEIIPQFGALANRSELCNKPLIAAIDGFAVGVGFELALMCDIRVIEETAIMGCLNRRFGIPMLTGGTVRLPAMIGYARAMDIVLTGRQITAKQAYAYGLCTYSTVCGGVLGTAINVAKSLVKFPQKALLADRASLRYATFLAKQMDEALQFEKDNASHILFEEGVTGAKKFINEDIGKHGKYWNLTPHILGVKELNKDLL